LSIFAKKLRGRPYSPIADTYLSPIVFPRELTNSKISAFLLLPEYFTHTPDSMPGDLSESPTDGASSGFHVPVVYG
jgi:hypothetical protein